MIGGGRGSQVGTCVEMDFSGLFSNERRRSRPGLLGNCSRNVAQELGGRILDLWRKMKRKRPKGIREWFWLLLVNVAVMGLTFLTGVITYESSVDALRQSMETTVIFPIYLPHAIALSVAGRLRWQSILGIFLGLYACRMYSAVRGMYLISVTRAGVLLCVAFLGTAEVYSANYFLYKHLMKEGCGKKVPTIEFIKEALKYLATVALCTLIFDTVIALVICTSPLVLWSNFYRFWGTSWLGVIAGMLTVSPVVTHLIAWKPKPSLFQPKKLFEAFGLTLLTGTLVVIIFVTDFHTVIYPLPYLLFPVIILTAFRFNRVGCSLVVSIISYVCAWASIRKKGAVYRMAGSPQPVSSPELILQVELFISVLGLVGILLAAAVREKKQLARDLHKMNEELESAVSERTIELVKANEALRESQRKAELANQAKSDFLANMSHEIRTPIHGIMGLTSLVLDSELSADQRENLISVQDCANVLLHIINSILDLAKIEAGRIEVEFVTFRVSQLVNSTVRMLRTRAKAKNLDLVWDIDPSVPHWLIGDSGKLQQCLLNLIGNAVKFTHQGSVRVHVKIDRSDGSVKRPSARRTADEHPRGGSASPVVPTYKLDSGFSSVSAVESPADWQCCNSDTPSNNGRKFQTAIMRNKDTRLCVPVIFEVHDSGIGVSPEKLQHIFTPFTQADASTSRLYGGTGLGLCIVQRFVELLGGKLQAESEVGKGSCFSFCVPLGYSTKNEDEKVFEPRDTMNGTNLLSPSIPGGEGEVSADEQCFGRNQHAAPPPPANATTCVRSDEGFPAISFNEGDHHFRHESTLLEDEIRLRWLRRWVNSESQVLHSQCTRDSFGSGNPPVALRETQSDVAAWKPSRSVENLDALLASWNQNGSRMRARDCECARSGSAPQQMSSFPSAKLSASVSPLAECSTSVPSTGFRTDDLDSHRSGQVLSCTVVQRTQPLGFPTQCLGQAPSPTLPQTDASPMKERDLKLRVLLAEDNLVNQKVASRQLQKHKHVVTVVGDGLQALEAVKANHGSFDLVLMDVQMPNMDGLEATRRIREYESQQSWKRLPILGLTAHAIHGYEETCLKSGMDGYLGKPFDVEQLLRVIDKYIPAKVL